jgi:phosphatidylglycerol:prolipoprotein diacylglycerol transferase
MHPILFQIGRFPVRAYGTLIVAGFLVALWRAMRRCRQTMATEPPDSARRINPDSIFDLGIPALLFGLVGARIVFALLNWSSYAQHPVEILKIWSGGLALHGGLLFGLLYMIGFCRIKKLPVYAVGDISAVSWSIGYAIARIGCLLNGCCYGGACSLPWAVRFPDERFPNSTPPVLTPPSHPTQLYGTAFNLVFFAILCWWEKQRRPDGELMYAYIGMYGLYRFVVEYFRVGGTADYISPNVHLTLTHIVSVGMMAASAMGIAWLRRNRRVYADASVENARVSAAQADVAGE